MSEKTFNISVTNDGVKVFPMHAHDAEEIVLYVEGEGVMRTNERDVKFFPGKILVIPRGIMHGSASDKNFKNVCVYCDFGEIKKVTEVSDTATGCVSSLIKIMNYYFYSDREMSESLLVPLKNAIRLQLNENFSGSGAVERVYLDMCENYASPDYSLKDAIKKPTEDTNSTTNIRSTTYGCAKDTKTQERNTARADLSKKKPLRKRL